MVLMNLFASIHREIDIENRLMDMQGCGEEEEDER